MNKNLQDFKKFVENQTFDKGLDKYLAKLFPKEEIEKLHPLPNQYIYVVDSRNSSIIYVSSSIENIIGYKPKEVNYNMLLENIHPDDRDIVIKAIKAAYKWGQSGDLGSKYNLMQLNYRFKHKDGSYRHIMRSGEIIKTDKTKKMIYQKSTCTDITDIKGNNTIDVKIYRNDEIVFSLSNDILAERKSRLTKMEQRIVDLIIDNLSSKQIAQKLVLSSHTIDTHRRNILRKLELDSTKALLFYGK